MTATRQVSIPCVPGDGLGNRFLLFEGRNLATWKHSLESLAIELCDRDFDGILVVEAGDREGEEPVLKILNRDGGNGGVCLNGLRVAALWGGEEEGSFLMDGRSISWHRCGDDVITVHLAGQDMPQDMEFPPVQAMGLRGVKVPFWNPHAVFSVEDVGAVDLVALAEEVCQQRELFPEGVNVELVAHHGLDALRMRVHERGVGETQACGSAAVAVALMAWAEGPVAPLVVVMNGGCLKLERAQDGGVLVRGKACLGEPEERLLSN